MVDVIRPIWKWIVFGVVASAAITVWIPPGVIAGWSNIHPALAGLAALAIALPLYVCATASVPIAAALIAQGMPTGAALVFLMAGPATNVATIGAVKRAFGGRVLAVYLGTVVIGSVGLAYLYDAFIPFEALGSMTHEHGHPWWAWASALVLAGLFVYFVFDDLRSAWLRRTRPPGPRRSPSRSRASPATTAFESSSVPCAMPTGSRPRPSPSTPARPPSKAPHARATSRLSSAPPATP